MLELRGVSKSYRAKLQPIDLPALKDLTCSFAPGELTAILGHNGAGKTTTIRIILGLLRPDRGEVFLNNRRLDQGARALLGYMPETNKLPLNLSCLELLWYHASLYPLLAQNSKQTLAKLIDQALERVGMSAYRHKLLRHLSKGLGRRAAWAVATLHNPQVIILDEPWSGLDPVGRQQMLQWIDEEKQQGKTIILSTHELVYLPNFCRKLYVLRNGQLVYERDDPFVGDHITQNYSALETELMPYLKDAVVS